VAHVTPIAVTMAGIQRGIRDKPLMLSKIWKEIKKMLTST